MPIGSNADVSLIAAVVLGWLFCAYVSAVIAEGKRYSMGRWFLIGLLLGPLAVLLASRRGENIPPDQRRACPKCGKTIKLADQRCRHCREWVALDGSVDRAALAGYMAGRVVRTLRRKWTDRGRPPGTPPAAPSGHPPTAARAGDDRP